MCYERDGDQPDGGGGACDSCGTPREGYELYAPPDEADGARVAGTQEDRDHVLRTWLTWLIEKRRHAGLICIAHNGRFLSRERMHILQWL